MAEKKVSAFMQPKKLSAELEAVVGKGPMPRSEIVSKIWAYIKSNNLQDTKDKRMINCDAKLKAIFGDKVHMMKMAGFISNHIS
jgi:chromatin remodeling complex protein RSC6